MDENLITVVTQKNPDGSWSWAATVTRTSVSPPQGKFATQDQALAAATALLKIPKGT